MSEQDYDEKVAPKLLALALECEELGMSLVARVEWEPGESGTTQIGIENSTAQKLTYYAARSAGNFDMLAMSCIRDFDVAQSMVLAHFAKQDTDT